MLRIAADNMLQFPLNLLEEHQEMILIDLKCKDNLSNLLNQVFIVTKRRLIS